MLTILPEIIMRYMQNQNIKRTTTEKIKVDTKKNNKKDKKERRSKKERTSKKERRSKKTNFTRYNFTKRYSERK